MSSLEGMELNEPNVPRQLTPFQGKNKNHRPGMQGGTAPAMHVHIQTSSLVRAAEWEKLPHVSFKIILSVVKERWSRACEPLGGRKIHLSADSAQTGLQEAAGTTQDGTLGSLHSQHCIDRDSNNLEGSRTVLRRWIELFQSF